jgi:hypothetical protein
MSDLAKVNRDKAKSQGFAALGVPVGSILVFKKDPAVTVKVLDGKNKVEYQGKPYSISALAKQLVGSPVSGYLYFKFEGKTLKRLVKSEAKPNVPESVGASVSEPAEKASEVPENPDVPTESGKSEVTEESGQDIDLLAGEIEEESAESSPDEAVAEIGA